MSKNEQYVEHWKDEPDDHDYPAAADYLSLILPDDAVQDVVGRLRKGTLVRRKAKDLLRASTLPLLPETNPHVKKDLAKVREGKLLSPVLIVRGHLPSGCPMTIADGYHRVCASYLLDENADIPCRMVGLSAD